MHGFCLFVCLFVFCFFCCCCFSRLFYHKFEQTHKEHYEQQLRLKDREIQEKNKEIDQLKKELEKGEVCGLSINGYSSRSFLLTFRASVEKRIGERYWCSELTLLPDLSLMVDSYMIVMIMFSSQH